VRRRRFGWREPRIWRMNARENGTAPAAVRSGDCFGNRSPTDIGQRTRPVGFAPRLLGHVNGVGRGSALPPGAFTAVLPAGIQIASALARGWFAAVSTVPLHRRDVATGFLRHHLACRIAASRSASGPPPIGAMPREDARPSSAGSRHPFRHMVRSGEIALSDNFTDSKPRVNLI
jgi:hypothetical protein